MGDRGVGDMGWVVLFGHDQGTCQGSRVQGQGPKTASLSKDSLSLSLSHSLSLSLLPVGEGDEEQHHEGRGGIMHVLPVDHGHIVEEQRPWDRGRSRISVGVRIGVGIGARIGERGRI